MPSGEQTAAGSWGSVYQVPCGLEEGHLRDAYDLSPFSTANVLAADWWQILRSSWLWKTGKGLRGGRCVLLGNLSPEVERLDVVVQEACWLVGKKSLTGGAHLRHRRCEPDCFQAVCIREV